MNDQGDTKSSKAGGVGWGGWLLEEKHAYVQSMLMYLSINVVETPELLVITMAYN